MRLRLAPAMGRGTLALVLALGPGQPVLAQGTTTATPDAGRGGATSRGDYEACLAGDETSFRASIEAVAAKALEASVRGIDYRLVIAEEWRKGGLDDVMARRVDAALDDLKQETSWSELISSLASKPTQEKLARSAAERVYGSAEMKKALETLATGVGNELGRRLEPGMDAAADGATRCLTTYLRHRYGNTFAQVIAKDARNRVEIDAAKGRAEVTGAKVLVEGKEGIAGLVVLIMRRQMSNLATRIGQRFVGAVLGRLVSVVAGGIGVVLIAKDFWELRNGVLPIIAAEMKSTATRDKVQAELASAIETELGSNVREIARGAAEKVFETLTEHRRAHAKVLELAERHSAFKTFLDGVAPEALGRLDEITGLALAGKGEADVLRRASDGTLGEAVSKWPSAALDIARDRRSLEAGFQWRALAGDAALGKVVDYGVHRLAKPETFTRNTLTRVLGLDDRVAISRLVSLPARTLEPLLELGDPALVKLARSLGETELESLSGYMSALNKEASKKLLVAVADAPMVMQALAPARDAVLASRDQAAALAILLRREELFDVALFWRDVTTVKAGEVSPRVLLARYPIALGVLALLGFGFILLLVRTIAGRRPRVVS